MSQQIKSEQFLNNLMNEPHKDKWWFNTNYYFFGTFFIIVLCITLFNVLWKGDAVRVNIPSDYRWDSTLNFGGILTGFINSFGHFNWQHVLLNMLCFAVTGLYFERKVGTTKWLLLIPTLAFFTSCATGLNNAGLGGVGFSGVNYGLYAILIIDYIFSFSKNKENKNKFNLILGGVIIALIYLAMCYNGGTDSFGFEWYPYDLFTNMGHYSGFLAGLVLALAFYISKIQKPVSKKANS